LVSGAQRNTFTSPRGLAISANGKVAVADAAQSAHQIVFGEPSITGLSRTRVPSTGGQALVVQGHNFSPESIVIVGGVVVTGARVESTERISLTTPALPSGITT